MTDTSNTSTEANRTVIRDAFEAWRDRTAAVTDVFAPDMVWRIEGHSLASKQYRDKQQFIDEGRPPLRPDSSLQTRSGRPRSDRSTPTATW